MKRKRRYKIAKQARLTDRLMMKTRLPNAPDKTNAGGNGDAERRTEFTKIEHQSQMEQNNISRAEEEKKNRIAARK